MSDPLSLAILLFDDVELLDFCGPYEVFSVANRLIDGSAFEVFTVAEEVTPVTTSNGLSVNPNYTLEHCPKADLLLIPGGIGTRQQLKNEPLIKWIREKAG